MSEESNGLLKSKGKEINNLVLLIKKMRLYKKLTREEASKLFPFSYKNIERLENGRGNVTEELVKLFQKGYELSDEIVYAIRINEIEVNVDANSIRLRNHDPRRKSKRFRQRIVTRECAVLKELRVLRNLEQGEAAKICNFSKRKIGFIENGRITLTRSRIEHIVNCYGFTMEFFGVLLKQDQLDHEILDQSIEIIKRLDPNKRRVVLSMLYSLDGK